MYFKLRGRVSTFVAPPPTRIFILFCILFFGGTFWPWFQIVHCIVVYSVVYNVRGCII